MNEMELIISQQEVYIAELEERNRILVEQIEKLEGKISATAESLYDIYKNLE
jgi:uncharacterized protein (UPF0335 family)